MKKFGRRREGTQVSMKWQETEEKGKDGRVVG